jgi:BMFP domain-containing protein YqiC
MSYAGPDQPIQPESNPYNMFNRLMLGSASAPAIKPEDLERIRVRRQSSLDLVRNELRSLATKIDAEDRIKLEQHVAGLEAIEKRLAMPPDAPSTNLVTGPPRMGIDLMANESFPEILAIQNSLAVAALATNRTRVASLMWGRSFSLVRHTWAGVDKEHHTLSHDATPAAELQKQAIETWFMQRMAELLKQLDSVREGDGTLLDHTMVIYCNELNQGSAHSASPAITFIAGSGGGKLKTGRLLNLGPTYDFAQLLCTACHVMGVTSVTRVGDLGNSGIIPTLLA